MSRHIVKAIRSKPTLKGLKAIELFHPGFSLKRLKAMHGHLAVMRDSEVSGKYS